MFTKHLPHSCVSLNVIRKMQTNLDGIFNDLGLTRFNDRYKYQTALLMFKAIHGIAPAYICDNVCFSYEVNGRNLRSYDNMTLHQPIPNYEICKRSLA